MTYALFTQSFGLSKANSPVNITRADTGVPAVILSSTSGGVLNHSGRATLNSIGDLSVIIDTEYAYNINIADSTPSRRGALQVQQEDNQPLQILDANGNLLFTPAVASTAQLSTGIGSTVFMDTTGQYLVDGLGNLLSFRNSVGTVIPPVSYIHRNSVNDTTDTNEVQMAVLTVPGSKLQVGSTIHIKVMWENSNSGSTKTFGIYIPTATVTNLGTNPTNTTNQSFGFNMMLEVIDFNTIALLNNLATSGGNGGFGSVGGTILTRSIPDLLLNGLQFQLTSKWGAAVSGEYISVISAKAIIYGQI